MNFGKGVAHPIALLLILVFGMISGRVVSNPSLGVITKIILVFLSLISSLLAVLFEYFRMEEK